MVVSHDRALLERVVTGVVEIDEATHRVGLHAGGWEHYDKARRDERRREEEAYARHITEKARLNKMAERQRQWGEQGTRRAKRMPRDADKFVRRAAIAGAARLVGRRSDWRGSLRCPTGA